MHLRLPQRFDHLQNTLPQVIDDELVLPRRLTAADAALFLALETLQQDAETLIGIIENIPHSQKFRIDAVLFPIAGCGERYQTTLWIIRSEPQLLGEGKGGVRTGGDFNADVPFVVKREQFGIPLINLAGNGHESLGRVDIETP